MRHRKPDAVDVCVIGAGAAGAVAAKKLGEAGFRVVVLEAGPRFNPASDYPARQFDFEVAGPALYDPPDPRRDLYTQGGGTWFNYNRVKAVGGSTLVYTAISRRFHVSDFRVRSLDGVADDWPITYEDLAPYYDEVERELGVAGLAGIPGEAPRGPYPLPPFGFNCASQAIRRGARQLGWELWPSPLAINSEAYDGRPPCIRCGATTVTGCPIGAKGTADVTYIRTAEATGRVDVRPQCTAREISVDAQGRARGVVYFDPEGREQEQEARIVVLAANAVESPRLLLLSKSALFPNGLANSSGLVGKYFTEHLAVFTEATFEQRLDPYRGPHAGGMIEEFYETRPEHGFVRGWTFEVNNGWLWPYSTARKIAGWGLAHKDAMRRTFGRMLSLATVGEQLPDVKNTVTLDEKVVDDHGVPAPKITHSLGANDQAMVQAIKARTVELLEAAGAVEIGEPALKPGGSSHYLGSCRMGNDARTSVLNRWCQSHDVPNLFIVDSSAFVTGGAANPALTIQALAAYSSDYIVEQARLGNL
jgi:choline dehydrogenase-like flavoprotein